ncbi:hypothetical protein, partial [Bacillus altitudinis]|uniref:hypothetical protein n=1 Tax=Bacillus altitudinis TaxID=293387 RepID=UPI00307DB0E4
MEIEFLGGRWGSGKRSGIVEEMKEEVRVDGLGRGMIFLVGDETRFLMEYAVAKTSAAGGMMRAQ